MGFSYEEALDQPVSRVLTLMAIEQIKHEGARLAGTDPWDEIDVFDNETMDIDQIFPPYLK